MRHDDGVRRDTAVRRLGMIAQRCQQVSGLWDGEPVLAGAYAFGDVLDGGTEVPVVQVAFVLYLPAEELTWCAQPPSCAGLPHLLEIDKAPVDWYWRPAVWPVSNHLIWRPLRIWSPDGVDVVALDAVARGMVEDLRMPTPSAEDQRAQLAVEVAASLAHLRRVEASFWERDWRQAHRGSGVYPEHHIWDAVHGYLDLLAAIGIDQSDARR
jgi:hypothetical protein